jgi:hypothetical protein
VAGSLWSAHVRGRWKELSKHDTDSMAALARVAEIIAVFSQHPGQKAKKYYIDALSLHERSGSPSRASRYCVVYGRICRSKLARGRNGSRCRCTAQRAAHRGDGTADSHTVVDRVADDPVGAYAPAGGSIRAVPADVDAPGGRVFAVGEPNPAVLGITRIPEFLRDLCNRRVALAGTATTFAAEPGWDAFGTINLPPAKAASP